MKTSWLIEGKRREVLMKQSEDQLVGGESEARVKSEVLGDNPRVMNSLQAVKTRGHP